MLLCMTTFGAFAAAGASIVAPSTLAQQVELESVRAHAHALGVSTEIADSLMAAERLSAQTKGHAFRWEVIRQGLLDATVREP